MCSYFDTTDGYLRFFPTIGQTTVPFFFWVVIFSGGSKNIAGQMTVPFFFRVIIFSGHNWCLYFDMSTNYGTYIRPEKITTRKKGTVVWPAMFFGGFKLQPEKLQPEKKKVQLSGQRLK